MNGNTFTCGRRFDMLAYRYGEIGMDRWRPDKTCSYCGSMSNTEFLPLVRKGVKVVPTDKNYKVYLERGGGPAHKFYFQHLEQDEAAMIEFYDLWREDRIVYDFPGFFYSMPYVLIREANRRATVQ
jgi:hypothetical protein